MKLGMLAAYLTDYNTSPNTDPALQATGAMPAIVLVTIAPQPEPLIGAYAQQVAQRYADQEGVMLRDFIERQIFRYQYEHREMAGME